MMTFTRSVRAYFARTEDPYAGGDLENARRIGTVIWGLLVALTVLLVPVNPPDEVLGAAGWAVAGALIPGGVLTIFWMRTGRLDSWNTFLFISYATVLGLGVIQWFSGGQAAPFVRLVLLPVLFVAATQPPRRIAPFMGMVLVVEATPFIYDS